MTTINTSEDLLRLLREDPHFYEQARRLILTNELITLPERFAAFAARVDDFIARQEQFNERVDAFIVERRGINQEQQATNQEQRGVNQRVERILADLRGSLTVRICRQNSDNIAAALGLSIVDHLTPAALRAMVRTSRPADATDGDLQSFYRADLIASALDQDDNEAYLAVEASFTADARDTRRAIRNANLLTELTGRPAHAVIAARHIDNDIRGRDSNQAPSTGTNWASTSSRRTDRMHPGMLQTSGDPLLATNGQNRCQHRSPSLAGSGRRRS